LVILKYFSKKKFSKNKTTASDRLKILFVSGLAAGITINSYTNATPILNKVKSKIYGNSSSSFITKAIEKSGPSVVTIDTQRIVRNKSFPNESRILLDPYFERIFGLRFPSEYEDRIEEGQGSGFIFDDGLVITNAHVINNTQKLIVGLSDGRKFKGSVIGIDLLTDLAVIKLEGKGPWPKAILGDSNTIKVGDWAIAVGNPFGLENTVTLGIISNLNRDVSQLGIYDKKFDLIQTDAAINPGNSGGPLLNNDGEVIGINTLIRSGPGAGLSFAIPINKAKKIANDLIRNGKVIHPMIGVSLLNEFNLENNINYVKVGYVVPRSPAEKSGILKNDLILKIDTKMISRSSDVVNAINNNGIKKSINILIKRKNRLINIIVKPIDIRNLSRN
tara:strand:- start:38276 stop:39445 length:1170 start_codon:yes stop_codon:yes gene_type:complete